MIGRVKGEGGLTGVNNQCSANSVRINDALNRSGEEINDPDPNLEPVTQFLPRF